ncbi:MAG: redoxin domain-containing protein [Anaerolineales bacterium]|nr:redoxin domain-containing protein [Anaerolineales bacterium]
MNHEVELEPPVIRMPPFVQGEWLNSPPLTREQLRGQVVLIDFWDYTCVNCVRTLPYLRAWHERYSSLGLVIVGIHAPEFGFARDQAQVKAAIAEFDLPYPVFLDNQYESWGHFANRAWPTKYLVDAAGYIRYKKQGEGAYQETEKAIQRLLQERDPAVALPDIPPLLRPEDATGAVCYRPTPELHAGYDKGSLFHRGLGNPAGNIPDSPMIHDLPQARPEGHFYAAGIWRWQPENLTFAGELEGRIHLPYSAVGVNAVLSPTADPVALMLNLWQSETEPLIVVTQDGAPLPGWAAGRDIEFDETGRSLLRITRPRLYEIVDNGVYGSHELVLHFLTHGVALFAFTFTTCVAPSTSAGPNGTFAMG